MNNNVEVFYCRLAKKYIIIDKLYNADSIYTLNIRDLSLFRTKDKCTKDKLIKSNLTEVEAQNLCIILNKLNPRK